ncbi:MAG: TonB-dependent receptor, partial [Bacteroidales bacterium]|nr:TonB-dependent receptor [Bacteroidales bacterium]
MNIERKKHLQTLGCLVVFVALLLGYQSGEAQTVSGTVTDKATGETLIGATVLDEISGKGTVTNAHGRYSLTIHQDSVKLRISYVGYASQLFSLKPGKATELNVRLEPAVELQTVTIRAERPTDPKSSQLSAIAIPVEHLKAVPVLFGEVDVLKTLQLMPGVQGGSEGMSGMYVRGGGPDENLFLLDGVPIYNVSHLGGFFSAFNADAVKNVTLYKGSFPARFGGRLSSVLDITTNNGNDKEYHGSVNIGLISAKLALEGPIVKEKTTFSLSARRTYGDLMLQPVLSMMNSGEFDKLRAGYYFYDFNGKITHKFSERSRLYASYYMGDDKVYARIRYDESYNGDIYRETMNMNMNWGNIVGSLRWNYVINPQLFMNITGSFTRYRNDIGMGLEYYGEYEDYEGVFRHEEESMEMTYKSGIRDYAIRADFDYSPDPNHSIKFGGSMIHHVFTPEVLGMQLQYDYSNQMETLDMDTTLGQSVVHANEINLFAEDDWSITDALKVNAGLALSGFAVEGTFYPSIQPRLSGRWLLSDDFSAKFGYAYMTQYLHLLSTSGINMPTDLWVPVTARIAPMNAHQVAAGLSYNLLSILDLSLEGYYKSMDNLMEYKDGASFFGSSVGWEDKVCLGR